MNDEPRKYLIYEPTGSAYWYDGDSLMYAPLSGDGSFTTFEPADGGEVEPDLVGEERIRTGNYKTLNDLYETLKAMHVAGSL